MAQLFGSSTGKVALTTIDQPLKFKSKEVSFTPIKISNSDLKLFVTNPITPPSEIIPNRITRIEALKTNKPEMVVDISKYFQTSYPDLEENYVMLFNERAIMVLPEFLIVVPMRSMLGNPKTKEEYNKMIKLVSQRPEILEGYSYREMNGVVSPLNIPKDLAKNIELLSKSHLFFYASHKDLEDYGMDMDYLTTPMIDHNSEGKEIEHLGYLNYPYLIQLAQYDKFLLEYTGVSTIGKLGRDLGLKGIPLYELWNELTKAGVVSDYIPISKNDDGEDDGYPKGKWLEVEKSVNVKELVANLKVPLDSILILEKYLLSLQNGKKRDAAFSSQYETLKGKYKAVVDGYRLLSCFLMGGIMLTNSTDKVTSEWFNNVYLPIANSWEKEFYGFDSRVRSSLAYTISFSDEKPAIHYSRKLIERLEAERELFQGRLPLGQEYLFDLLRSVDKVKNDEDTNGFYDVKVK